MTERIAVRRAQLSDSSAGQRELLMLKGPQAEAVAIVSGWFGYLLYGPRQTALEQVSE
jgi:hypothetical protein